MPRKPEGLYTGADESSFRSKQELLRQTALNLGSPLLIESHVDQPLTVYEHLDKAKELSEQIFPPQEAKVKAFVPNTSTIAIIADTHAFHPNTNHERIQRELQAVVNTPDTFVILNGDIVDGIFWGGESGGEQIGSISNQHSFLRAMFKELKGRVIVATSGEHDSKWAAKTGSDPYSQFAEITGSPYVRGVAEVELDVGDQNYRLVVQHKAKGYSMYNKNHPTSRQARFDLQGADVYISAHTHRKQVSQEGIKSFDGSRVVTHVSTGPYKSGDAYGERQGYSSQDPAQMFGAAIRLHADTKQVDVQYDILQAIKQWNE